MHYRADTINCCIGIIGYTKEGSYRSGFLFFHSFFFCNIFFRSLLLLLCWNVHYPFAKGNQMYVSVYKDTINYYLEAVSFHFMKFYMFNDYIFFFLIKDKQKNLRSDLISGSVGLPQYNILLFWPFFNWVLTIALPRISKLPVIFEKMPFQNALQWSKWVKKCMK